MLLNKQSEAKTIRKIVFRVLLAAVILLVLAAGAIYVYIQQGLKPVDSANDKPVKVSIPIGSSVGNIAHKFKEAGLIRDEKIFKYYVKFKNASGFRAGEYILNKSMTMDDMITLLESGKASQNFAFQITVPEGQQLSQIAKLIAKNTNYNEQTVMKKLQDKTFINQLRKKYPETLKKDIDNKKIKYPLEGYLYPATYPFDKKDTSLEKIIETMIEPTDEVVRQYSSQISQKKLTVHQFLTMASLIEEEATQKVDRGKISSVFYNRLEKKMPLQTDPTVLYALGAHKSKVFLKDLKVKSPYNTYTNKGLPPGPISNAGTTSLDAAINPEKTDYLYFLAAKDGKVIFTKTLKDHNKVKEKLITNQK
ncbi:endolytic transglycosylase MltG [Metabacillus sp. RGM 3146]|uniref:endolytic transglycosylase MltG n=1 Tax=Metabacillus sp. RGM 3146 TaxID=3401092 RepID=UPI003B9BC765